jgi:hypothetical protein
MSKEINITWTEFEEKYKPIQNELVEDAAYNDCMFETYGEEVEKVWETEVLNVWTIFDNDDIVSGRWRVNRLGYLITKVARKQDEMINVIWD